MTQINDPNLKICPFCGEGNDIQMEIAKLKAEMREDDGNDKV